MINPTRRGFLGMLLAAPVIVKAASLMPVKALLEVPETELLTLTGYDQYGKAVTETYPINSSIGGCRPMSSAAFREIVEPVLNEMFNEIYSHKPERYLVGLDSRGLLERRQVLPSPAPYLKLT